MKSSGGRWYVSVLTALAAVAMIWGMAEQPVQVQGRRY